MKLWLPFYPENNTREYYSNLQFKMSQGLNEFLQTNSNSTHWAVFGVKRYVSELIAPSSGWIFFFAIVGNEKHQRRERGKIKDLIYE
jgi:hypothetical protein